MKHMNLPKASIPWQTSLFEVDEPLCIAIDDAAQQAGVSPATIRNWIKTGYLKKERRGYIDSESFANFLRHIAGMDKLTSRANKSLKDSHDHTALSSDCITKLAANQQTHESISSEYEASLSDSYRNKEGIYYTPLSIVCDLLRPHKQDVSSKTFCDPCCGSGNFIIRAIDLGFKPENVFGYDTDPVAVALTRKRIFEKTGYQSKNILQADFLAIASKINNLYFDYIYTNPPWGKKLSRAEKELYGVLFRSGKNVDTSTLFFCACLKCLHKHGELGLLLPESFFNIATFENARSKSLALDIQRLVDYGKPFKGLVTKALAIVLLNQTRDDDAESISCESSGREFHRSARSFIRNPKSILNLHCDPNASDVIRHVLSIPHITLDGHAKWGLGIVTGNNNKFSRTSPADDYIPVLRGADIKKDRILEPSCFIPAELSLYQQVAPVEFYESKIKLIYKFISADLCFFYDTEQRYILNSANMLIPSNDFPLSGTQLCSLLNSNFINWLFKSLFNTHKILRGDLEMLPIHADYFNNNNFDEISFLAFLHLEKHPDGTYRVKK